MPGTYLYVPTPFICTIYEYRIISQADISRSDVRVFRMFFYVLLRFMNGDLKHETHTQYVLKGTCAPSRKCCQVHSGLPVALRAQRSCQARLCVSYSRAPSDQKWSAWLLCHFCRGCYSCTAVNTTVLRLHYSKSSTRSM